MFPADHFPSTPAWAQQAVAEAIERLGLSADRWQVPLEAIGRYESNFNPAANLCSDPDANKPVGITQQTRLFYDDAKKVAPVAHQGLGTYADPVRSFVMAAMHIDSQLTVSGGYDGIGRIDGTKNGLLPRTDRGPGNVLRAWIAGPDNFSVEAARDFYRGY